MKKILTGTSLALLLLLTFGSAASANKAPDTIAITAGEAPAFDECLTEDPTPPPEVCIELRDGTQFIPGPPENIRP